jgi:hypothetical protein
MRSLLFVEGFEWRPSSQYILVRVIPRCFRFAKMCSCQVSLLSRCSPRDLTSSWRVAHSLYGPGGGAGFSSYSGSDVAQLGSVCFHSPLLKPVLGCK